MLGRHRRPRRRPRFQPEGRAPGPPRFLARVPCQLSADIGVPPDHGTRQRRGTTSRFSPPSRWWSNGGRGRTGWRRF